MENRIFDHIIYDNVSGSGTIVAQIQETLLKLADSEKNIRLQKLNTEFKKLRNHFPQFGVLFHFLKSFDEAFHGQPEIDFPELRKFIIGYRRRWAHVQQNAIRDFCNEVDLAGKTILLHSNSSTIHQLFEQDFKQKPTIFQTLSSPANEGLMQATFLSKKGYQVTLFHEDALSKYLSGIDMAVLGADLILDDVFLNKIGSFPIALLCKHFNKPVYVIADRRKKVNPKEISEADLQLLTHEKPKPAHEITTENNAGIQILNEYFEFTPINLVKKLFL